LASDLKRVRRVQYPELDAILYDWFLRFERQIRISGDLINEKAAIIFKALYPKDITSFKFSNGWLEDWKIGHGIREYKQHGESGDVDLRVVDSNLPMLRNVLECIYWVVFTTWMMKRHSFTNSYLIDL